MSQAAGTVNSVYMKSIAQVQVSISALQNPNP